MDKKPAPPPGRATEAAELQPSRYANRFLWFPRVLIALRDQPALAISTGYALLALIGLTVGLIIALAPLLTVWGSSALVVALLALGAWIAMRAAGARWAGLMQALDGGSDRRP